MMRRTPAKVPVTDQNNTGLNQSSQSLQSLLKQIFYDETIFYVNIRYLAVGGGGGGNGGGGGDGGYCGG